MTDAAGPPLGAGRDADVYALDERRVLRRYQGRDVLPREVLAMAAAARAGFAVPRVYSFSGPEMILERIDGPTMQSALETASHARVVALAGELAALHARLHRIAAPADFPTPFGEGGSLLHLDLHPGNVLLSERGPVVIDWANAARGPGAADVAVSAVIFETATVPAGAEGARRTFLAAFLDAFEPNEVASYRQAAARYRLAQQDHGAPEREALERLLG